MINCPKCNEYTKVIDSRGNKRRRACIRCKHKFNTFEEIETPQDFIKVPKDLYDAFESFRSTILKNQKLRNWKKQAA